MENRTQFRSDRLAVLIDADNASAKLIEPLLKEIAKYGTAHIKRIYGDWTTERLSGWKEKLTNLAIQPIQQFAYTANKNAIDIALVIDAMDLLHTQKIDGFCIVSSDSDFTRLAIRIRESGFFVYGFGKKQTPIAFVSACDKFIYTEIFDGSESTDLKTTIIAPLTTIPAKQSITPNSNGKTNLQNNQSSNLQNNQNQKITKELLKLLRSSYDLLSKENDWVDLGKLKLKLTQLAPSFNIKNYGCKNLSALVKASGLFEIKAAKDKLPFQIRLKETKNETIVLEEIIKFLQKTYTLLANDNSWVDISLFGKEIKKLSPSFSSKKYGYRNLSMLIQTSGLFERQNTKIRLKRKVTS
ncbi:hypothetical protein TUMEXPCC7403_18255 [Tumidithrix helvetica PCC 7403]|uniref:NYN domain-containing protein n=1 Tax=Tumidithrix helvetica TaxID=3457545 RepID=UPI003CAD2A9B